MSEPRIGHIDKRVLDPVFSSRSLLYAQPHPTNSGHPLAPPRDERESLSTFALPSLCTPRVTFTRRFLTIGRFSPIQICSMVTLMVFQESIFVSSTNWGCSRS